MHDTSNISVLNSILGDYTLLNEVSKFKVTKSARILTYITVNLLRLGLAIV